MNYAYNTGKIFCLNRGIWMQINRLLCCAVHSAHTNQSAELRNQRRVESTSQTLLRKKINISFCCISNRSSCNTTAQKNLSSVKHDTDCRRFYVEVDDMGCAFLQYDREDHLIKLMHTEVPAVLGGRGLGKILAKEALDFVAKNDFQLEIHCQFVRNYVSKNEPKYIKYLK